MSLFSDVYYEVERDADFGADEHWVWRRDFGGIGIETKEGDPAE